MKHVVLSMFTIVVLSALYGCTATAFMKTGKTYPPYDGDVQVLYLPLEDVHYEVVGIVSVDEPWGTRSDLLVHMKQVAALNGANAVVMCSNQDCPPFIHGDSRLTAPAIRVLPKTESIAAAPPSAALSQPKTDQGVVPKAPAPPPTKEETTILEKGRITLNIQFDTNKAAVKDVYYDHLARFADVMRRHPDLTVTIEGHTDNVGNDDLNMKLSQIRADSVKDYLVMEFGIDASRLNARGYGETRPVVDNGTEEGRQRNRRVEAAVEYEKTVE